MHRQNNKIKKKIAKPASAAPPMELRKLPQQKAEQASMLKVVTSTIQDFAREAKEAKNYWKGEGVHPASYAATPHYVAAIAEIVNTIRADHVFEFGCGSGRNLAALKEICANHHLKCAGIDISPSLIAVGRSKFNLQIEEGDENTLQSIGDDLYDLVFTVSVLDHLPDPSIAIGHLARISRGWCLFVEPHKEALSKQSLRLEKVQNRRAQKQKEKSAPYTYLHDYRTLFKRHGLKIALEFSLPTHHTRSGPLYRLWFVHKIAEGVQNLPEPALKSLDDRVLKIAFLNLLSNVQTARQAQVINKAIIIELRGNERELLKEAMANKAAARTAGKELKAAQTTHDSEQKKALEALTQSKEETIAFKKELKAAQTTHDSEQKKALEALTQSKEEASRLQQKLQDVTHEKEVFQTRAGYLQQQKANAVVRAERIKESLSFRLGDALIHGFKSWGGFTALLTTLVGSRRGVRYRKSAFWFKGMQFGRVMAAYERGGLAAVDERLRKAKAKPKVVADSFLALARQLQPLYPAQAARAAQRAHKARPDPSILKWLAFRLFEAGEIEEPARLLKSLPEGTVKSTSEIKRAGEIDSLAGLCHQKPKTEKAATPSYTPRHGTLLYVAASALPYHVNGYANRTHGLLQALTKLGVEVTAMTRPGYPWDRKSNPSVPADGATKHDGVRYLHFRKPAQNMPLDLYWLEAEKIIAELAKSKQVAVIQAASNYVNAMPALMAAQQLGVPFYYEMRGLWDLSRTSKVPGYEDSERFRLAMDLEAHIARSADHVYVISRQLGEYIQTQWGIAKERISLLPNGVDVAHFPAVSEGDSATIGYAGSLVPYEGLDLLLEAIRILHAQGIAIRATIIGEGESRSALERKARELGVADRVTFTGARSPEEARKLLAQTGLICLPRKPYEVCELIPPLKLTEAMALAKPVIVPDLPVFRDEVKEGKTGLFFKAGDAEDLARVIQSCLADAPAARKIGNAARAAVLRSRTWDKSANDIAERVGVFHPDVLKARFEAAMETLKTERSEKNLRATFWTACQARAYPQANAFANELIELEEKSPGRVQQQFQDAIREKGKLQSRVNLPHQQKATAMAHAERVKAGLSFRLGDALIHGFKSWHNILKLPNELYAIGKEARQRRAEKLQKEAVKSLSQQALDALIVSRHEAPPQWLGPLRIAGVMDEFTAHSYAPECDLLQLHPLKWQEQLEAFKPDFLFLESAWRGLDGLWQLKISNAAREILDVIDWCRTNKIPVAFWNKEDPVHFDTFLPIASQADHVFTTDIDCIPKYKYKLGHERVYFLPFAAQPKKHNPIEVYTRKNAFNFAGSYYLRYPERQKDFDTLIGTAESFLPVEIYDRNYNNPHPHYTFPTKYAGMILGNLPFSEIDRAYKGYRFGININTSKQSQTMFARRVFELLASNTVTVSNFSRGMRLLFGDLVISSDEAGPLRQRLEAVCENETLYRKLRLMGLRKIMSEHTYAHRLAYIRAKLSKDTYRPQHPGVVVAAVAHSRTDYDHLVACFQRQEHPNKALFIWTGFSKSVNTAEENIYIFSDIKACCKAVQQAFTRKPFFAFFHAEDHYGQAYLTDLVLADRYSNADAFGKATFYEARQNTCRLKNDGAQYRPVIKLLARAALVRSEYVTDDWLQTALSTPKTAALHLENMLALDEFHYCRNGSGLKISLLEETLEDLPLADTGVSLDKDLFPVAESLRAPPKEGVSAVPDPSLSEIGGAGLFQALNKPATTDVRLEEKDGTLQIVSTLPADKHTYFYAREPFTREQCNFVLDNRFKLDCYHTMDLRTVFEFQNAEGTKIGHSINPVGNTIALPIPPECRKVRFGFRVSGRGKASVRRISFGGLNERPALMLGRSSLLVLTRQYPAYDDLYKYGFLHTRVLGYRQRGVAVDVFCFKEMAEERYYREFKGIDITSGDAGLLDATLSAGRHRHVLVHLLDQRMWEVLKNHVGQVKVTVWIHGAEIQPFHRREYNMVGLPPEEVARQKILSEQRLAFWRGLLREMPDNLHLVFVSKYLAKEVMKDLGFLVPKGRYSVIHNPIDTNLFAYRKKTAEHRKKILSIRPFYSRKYANDLSVAAILELKNKPFFKELEFHLVGDGELFDETTAPLQGLSNVTLEKRFLTQEEIAALHQEYGICLIPTRMDSQGVSRDEAMSSGLVPVTNKVAAIPEFVDESCGRLVAPEDAKGLAAAIEELYKNPSLFLKLSKAASQRVRRQSGAETILARELALMGEE